MKLEQPDPNWTAMKTLTWWKNAEWVEISKELIIGLKDSGEKGEVL